MCVCVRERERERECVCAYDDTCSVCMRERVFVHTCNLYLKVHSL